MSFLVNFMGCPSSGKTTLAAKLFASLKEGGYSCEFITEEARRYIATKKVLHDLKTITLDDEDQLNILQKQYGSEWILKSSTKDSPTVVISDSSPILSKFYMVDNESNYVNEYIQKSLELTDATFILFPVAFMASDPNRVHNKEQAMEIHQKIIKFYDHSGSHKLHLLPNEAIDSRFSFCYDYIVNELLGGIP